MMPGCSVNHIPITWNRIDEPCPLCFAGQQIEALRSCVPPEIAAIYDSAFGVVEKKRNDSIAIGMSQVATPGNNIAIGSKCMVVGYAIENNPILIELKKAGIK